MFAEAFLNLFSILLVVHEDTFEIGVQSNGLFFNLIPAELFLRPFTNIRRNALGRVIQPFIHVFSNFAQLFLDRVGQSLFFPNRENVDMEACFVHHTGKFRQTVGDNVYL